MSERRPAPLERGTYIKPGVMPRGVKGDAYREYRIGSVVDRGGWAISGAFVEAEVCAVNESGETFVLIGARANNVDDTGSFTAIEARKFARAILKLTRIAERQALSPPESEREGK